MPDKIVITGGKGFVGRYLVNELRKTWPGVQISIWDLPETDITDVKSYEHKLKGIKPDWIVHLAAMASVGGSFRQPEKFDKVNVEGTRNLFEQIVNNSPDTKVLAVSSADIYGLAGREPIMELKLNEANPQSPYARSKLKMESLIEREFNDLCVRARPFPHIGPGQKRGFVTADFAAQISAIEAGRQHPLVRVGNLEAVRDFTDVRDIARAYRLLMQKGRTKEVYNIASGRGFSIKTVLNKLLSLSSADIEIEKDPDMLRPSDNPIAVGDAGRIMKTTGWRPRISFDQSLRDILNYWRKRLKR